MHHRTSLRLSLSSVLAALAALGALGATPSFAAAVTKPVSDAQIRQNVKSCKALVAAPEAKKKKVYTYLRAHEPRVARVLGSTDGMVRFCQGQIAQGTKRLIALEHEYADWYRHRNDPVEDSSPSAPEEPTAPAKSSSLSSGTCYSIGSCNGSSTHVDIRVNCPAGSSSFQADFGGNGCESY